MKPNREEEIREASIEHTMSTRPMAIAGDDFSDVVRSMNVNPSFIAGAEWADKNPREGLVDIEKACKAIEDLLAGYIIRNFNFGDSYGVDTFVSDFRSVMLE